MGRLFPGKLKSLSVRGLLASVDKSTEGGRARERYRRVTLTAASSALVRVISLSTMIISVRLIVTYFGAERYALWATLTSTIALLVFADFGVGNGLMNAISECDGRGDQKSARCYVSTGFFVLLALALAGAALFWLLYPFVPWSKIYNVSSQAAILEAGPASAVFICCSLVQIPLGVVSRIQLGYQEGYYTQLWNAGGNLLGLLGLFAVIRFHEQLSLAVLAIAGAPVLTGILNALVFFGVQKPWLRPRLVLVSRSSSYKILKTGFLFFTMQIAGTVGYETDNLIIAQVLGAPQVAQYSVPYRLFATIPAMVSIVVMPLWPAYAEALARGDSKWVKTTLRRSILVGLGLAIPANVFLILFGRPIVRLWVGSQINPSFILLAGLAIWSIFSGISGPLAVFLNGIGFIRVQAICSGLMAVSNIFLSIVLTRHIGVSGVIYGSIISMSLFIFVPYSLFIPHLLSRVRRIPSSLVAQEV